MCYADLQLTYNRGVNLMSKTLVQALSTRICYTINLNTTLSTAIKELVDNKIGALPVVNTNGFLKGIISERDIIKQIHSYGTIESLTVETVMTKKVITCSLESSANQIMKH